MKNLFRKKSKDNSDQCFGACDVVVVKHKNGLLNSTPFVVNVFGAMSQSDIELEINGNLTDIRMMVNHKMYGEFVNHNRK